MGVALWRPAERAEVQYVFYGREALETASWMCRYGRSPR
jgi:hypothetical protein